MNPWLVFSLILLGIWFIILVFRKRVRKRMLWASILTAPFGLTEPIFVPEYWSPPSLFNLTARTGFDIESIIFSFAIGGIGAVLYGALFKIKHIKMTKHEMHSKRHRFHLLALWSAPIVFVLLYLITNLNPIYSTSIAMFVGGIAALLCRPNLRKKIWVGGIMFLVLYFIFFFIFNIIYPDFVQETWNFSTISGILILGVPLEELIFAFTFGMLWSSIYEHIKGYKIKE